MLVGKKQHRGFSTLELLIALAILVTVIVGAVEANISLQYWRLTTMAATESLSIVQAALVTARTDARVDFPSITDTSIELGLTSAGSTTAGCTPGDMCYRLDNQVHDISSCAKDVAATVSWRLGVRYPTSTVVHRTYLLSVPELVAKYGDCTLAKPSGNWASSTPTLAGAANHGAQFSTGIDVFEHLVYVVASSAPQLRIYAEPQAIGENPALVGSTSMAGNRLNAIDVIRDMVTGRRYAYVMQHTKTDQLGVIDVTDPYHPLWLGSRTLAGVFADGSFPQGWRVVAYGNRLYVFTRETAGPELHIFDITIPEEPTEITAAAINVGRTVNNIAVHAQIFNSQPKRYLFLAASAATKELTVLDVTDDISVPVAVVDLPGDQDVSSLQVLGSSVYLGRKNNSGPELYRFEIDALLAGDVLPAATSEVGADVTTLQIIGPLLFMGTNKAGAQFQIWNSDSQTWSATIANAGRLTAYSFTRLAPLGFDSSSAYFYLINQSATQSESMQVLYTPL